MYYHVTTFVFSYFPAALAAHLQGINCQLTRELDLHEVTPLSLGFGTASGLVEVVIKRNTPIPFRNKHGGMTSVDYQTTARFPVSNL